MLAHPVNNCNRKHVRIAVKKGDVLHPRYKVMDISESGIKCAAASSVSPGTQFMVIVNTLENALSIRCEVVWCRESPSVFDSDYIFGCKFVEVKTSYQLQIRRLVESRLR